VSGMLPHTGEFLLPYYNNIHF